MSDKEDKANTARAERVQRVLQWWRATTGESDEDIYSRTGVDRGTFNAWARGRKPQNRRKFDRFCEKLGLNPNGWMFDGGELPDQLRGPAEAPPNEAPPDSGRDAASEQERFLARFLKERVNRGRTLTGEEFAELLNEIDQWFESIPNRRDGNGPK